MVEAMLVAEELTTEMIFQGSLLLQSLDKGVFTGKAAFWWLRPETASWKLVLASPDVRTAGPILLYRKTRTIVKKLIRSVPITMDQILIIDVNDPLIPLIAPIIGTDGSAIVQMRIRSSVVNGILLGELLIYRMAVSPLPAKTNSSVS